MNDDERKLLDLLSDSVRDLSAEVRSIKQTLHGPPGYPNGLVGEIREIKLDVKACREENKAEGKKTRDEGRTSNRNLGLTILGSLLVLIAARVLGIA